MRSFNVSHFLSPFSMSTRAMPLCVSLLALLLSAGGAHASVARLEADLQTLWGSGEQLIEIESFANRASAWWPNTS